MNKANLKSKSGQAGIEFMFLVILALIIFSVFYVDLSSRQADFLEYKISREAEFISDTIAYNINIAFASSDGYSANFTIPQTIIGSSYNTTVENNSIFVKWNNRTVFSGLVSSDVQGTPFPGRNSVLNIGGVVFVSGI